MAASTVANLRHAGAEIDVDSHITTIAPRPLHAVEWRASTVGSALAGLLLGLAVEGVTVTGWNRAEAALPGLTAEWLRMISADEYLVPGSARLPYEFGASSDSTTLAP